MLSVVRICLNMHHSCIQWQAGQWAWRLPLSTFLASKESRTVAAGPSGRGAPRRERGPSREEPNLKRTARAFTDATRKKGSPKLLRGRSLGTKLSEAEYAQWEKSAARARKR